MTAIVALVALLVSGCVAPTPPSSTPAESHVKAAPLPGAVYAAAEEAIPALIVAERHGSKSGDLAALSQLWMDDARIIDGRNTALVDDDYIWDGKAAILDRYLLAVFPNPPPPLDDALLQFDISVNGAHAAVVNGVDEWRFSRGDGRWWIRELAYLRP